MDPTEDSDAGREQFEAAALPVRVVARARPLLPSETIHSTRSCVAFDKDGTTLIIGKDRTFTFDAVYGPSAQQERIYNEWVSALVDGFYAGYNATVLAYGQTGAGKTYTMGSGNNAGKLEEDLGVIPRVMSDIYAHLNGGRKVSIRVSYIEIYNEEVKDLLHPATLSKAIAIRERADGTIVLSGVKEVNVDCYETMQRLLEEGSLSRTVAGTLMNNQSSRSHSIFTITMEQRVAGDLIGAKFHLVDLAGSERAKRTGNVGVRLKESVNINTGLLALGNVISALGDEKKKASHVPYRESKLTRMLQDSLGGNSRTLMVACISPADASFEETLNTLKYANRARNIKNKPFINKFEEPPPPERNDDELERLKAELARFTEIPEDVGAEEARAEVEALTARNKELEAALQDKAKALQRAEGAVRRMGEQTLQLIADKEQALVKLEEAQQQLQTLGDHVRRMSETRAMRQSLRASLQTVEHQLNEYQLATGAEPRAAPRVPPAGQDRPYTAPEAPTAGVEDARLLHLRLEAEKAHRALESKTRELVDLERILADSQARVAHSVADLPQALEDEAAEARRRERKRHDAETRSVIERNLRKIKRLEDEVIEAQRERDAQAAQVAELREDLARDEEIFAAKACELRTAQTELASAHAELERLASLLEASEAEKAELRQRSEADRAEALRSAAASAGGVRGGLGAAKDAAGAHQQEDDGKHEGRDDGLTVTLQQRANRAMASVVDDDDLVQVGDDLEDSMMPASSRQRPASGVSPDKVLEQGFAALEAEKARLAEEKSALEQQAHTLSRQFHMDQHKADRRLKALEFNMQLKQDLIRNLVKTEQTLSSANEIAEEKISQLEREVESMRAERDRTSSGGQGSARATPIKPENMDPDHRRIRDQFTAKLRAREAELESLKKQQEESKKILRDYELGEKKIRTLENEISKMAQQCDTLKKKARSENDRYEEIRTEHNAKMKELKGRMEQRVKELEAENERQREALVRKNEELDGARSALRTRQGSRGQADSSFQSKREWLDHEIANYMTKKEAMDQLESELRQREEIIREKEDASRRRAGLELKRGRKQEETRQSIIGLDEKILQISQQMSLRGDIEPLQQLRQDEDELYRKREEAVRQRNDLEDKAQRGAYLTREDEQALGELDDRLEALDMEIEYKGQAISELRREIERSGGARGGDDEMIDALLQNEDMVHGMTKEEAQSLLQQCVQRVLVLMQVEKKKDTERRELLLKVEEVNQCLAEMQENLRSVQIDADRMRTQQQREHEEKVQFLLKQINQKETQAPGDEGGGEAGKKVGLMQEQIAMLDKDNFYYKQSNMNLKRKLRELTSAGEHEREVLEKSLQELEEAKSRNAKLEAELMNLRGYVHKTVGASAVRVSRQELRPLSAKDVEELRASRSSLNKT